VAVILSWGAKAKRENLIMNRLFQGSALVAMLLFSGITLAAAESSAPTQSKDQLTLTSAQNKMLLQTVNKQNPKEQTAPVGFSASIGASVPASISISRLPNEAVKEVPAAKSYDFAMVQKKLLIVNPKDRKVAEIITQ